MLINHKSNNINDNKEDDKLTDVEGKYAKFRGCFRAAWGRGSQARTSPDSSKTPHPRNFAYSPQSCVYSTRIDEKEKKRSHGLSSNMKFLKFVLESQNFFLIGLLSSKKEFHKTHSVSYQDLICAYSDKALIMNVHAPFLPFFPPSPASNQKKLEHETCAEVGLNT
jgi:hypothetical protein